MSNRTLLKISRVLSTSVALAAFVSLSSLSASAASSNQGHRSRPTAQSLHHLYLSSRSPQFQPPAALPYAPEYESFAKYRQMRFGPPAILSSLASEYSASRVICQRARAPTSTATYSSRVGTFLYLLPRVRGLARAIRRRGKIARCTAAPYAQTAATTWREI